MLTPHQLHLAEQASTEMDLGQLMHLIAELCRAIDSEYEENRQLRNGCRHDCREYEWSPLEAIPGWMINSSLEVPSPPWTVAI
jgi:hypothetical protein